MIKGKYWLGILFILILLTPFEVSGEERTERVIINFHNEIDENLLNDDSIKVHHLFEDYKAASVTIPVSMKDDLKHHQVSVLLRMILSLQPPHKKVNWGYQRLGNRSGLEVPD